MRIDRRLRAAAAVAGALLLQACGTVNTRVREDIEQVQKKAQTLETPVQIAPVSRVREIRGALIPVTSMASTPKGAWLKQIRVQLEIRNPVPVSAVVAKFAEQGINLTSDLPLESISYVGKINATDGETALRAVLGSVGLDYEVDDGRRLVVIKPMSSRSWYLSIGNRKSTYATDPNGASATTGTAGATTGTSGGATGTSGGTATPSPTASPPPAATAASAGGSGGSGSAGNTQAANGTGVAAADDFWSSLASELTSRLSVMVPRAMISARPNGGMPPLPNLTGISPPAPGMMPPFTPSMGAPLPGSAGGGSSGELYLKRQIGSFALNAETGSITVQAPHWVLGDLDAYLKRVEAMYNTDLSFQGELVLLTSSRSDSEGFDVSAFGRWAEGKYGAIVANNALGGVTVTLPQSGVAGAVTAGAQAVGGPLVGLTYAGVNALNLFNAYLSEIGQVTVVQRPLVTTTSGVPGIFSKKFTDYYNTVSQQAAAGGTGSAATATQNVLVPVELGTELRINPRIDISTGLIRAQLTLNQVVQSGSKTVPQTITFGNNATTVNTTIPLLTKQHLSGEILLRDGDLIVVGGQTEDNLSANENGLPGEEGPIAGILGVKRASQTRATYYFALRVAVAKRR